MNANEQDGVYNGIIEPFNFEIADRELRDMIYEHALIPAEIVTKAS